MKKMNPFDLLKNPAAINEQLQKMNDELKNVLVTGVSGGGIVKVTINGTGEMTDIYLDSIAVDPRDIKMLQDLIVAAHNKARTDLADKLKEKMGPLSGKFNFPGFN